jgi:hypothetical protein
MLSKGLGLVTNPSLYQNCWVQLDQADSQESGLWM